MPEFRKKPVVIEATQWHRHGDVAAVRPYMRDRLPVLASNLCEVCTRAMADHGWINTLEAGHRVCPGDWIITGVKNEMYPCKPDIFAETYEPAGGAEAACEEHW